jgi:uncharacterized membrane protein YkoI
MRVPGKWKVAVASTAVVVAGGVGVAAAAGGSSSPSGSRLDDGKQYLPQAAISEQQAIAAAQQAATGGLNEVDLEHAGGRLVWNVDVGSSDVRVDAATGRVVGVAHDD